MTHSPPYVILLHGLGRTKKAMGKMADFLTTQGYEVYNDDYRSATACIEGLTDQIEQRIRQHCPDENRTMHFVCHSMGGIIARLLIAKYRPKCLGRVVMLATPNRGSQLINFLIRFEFFRRRYGPAAIQMNTHNDGIFHQLSAVDYEVGVIAGDRSIDLLFSWFILSGKNDGKVTIEETKLDGMRDHIVLHATHPFMASNTEVIKQTAYFLQNGRFYR